MFLQKLCYALISFDPNIIGLILGVVGAILVTIFGMPSIDRLSEASYIEMSVTPKIRMYNFFSRSGLILILLGFTLQLVPAVNAIHLPSA